MLKGIGVSPGVVWGKAAVVRGAAMEIPEYPIPPEQVEAEIARFHEAVDRSRSQLASISEHLGRNLGHQHTYILDTHILILDDPAFAKTATEDISQHQINAEWALRRALDQFLKVFDDVADEYIKERRRDVEQVGGRVLHNLLGQTPDTLAGFKEPVILVAHDLTPADTLQLTKGKVLGFTTDIGSATSHTAIMARALEIPAVVGLRNISERIETGDLILIDGDQGIVVLNPSQDVLGFYKAKQVRLRNRMEELEELRDLPSRTTDAKEIILSANIESAEEVETARTYGAQGVGLFRTEYLFINRRMLPSEEEQFQEYRQIAQRVHPHCAVIRTVDLGGDKFLSPLQLGGGLKSTLGLRAIRFSLKEIPLFKVQLRAILRASHYGKLKLMFPLISGVEELRRAREILAEAGEELHHSGFPFDPALKVGVMIETPSAVFIADLLAQEADFFSIGTNDLSQYCLAIDRVNEEVAYLYDPLHPSILRSIHSVVQAAHSRGLRVDLCGEMSGDPLNAIILLGLELDGLSMNPLFIPRMKQVIRALSFSEVRDIAAQALLLATGAEVRNYLKREADLRFGLQLH